MGRASGVSGMGMRSRKYDEAINKERQMPALADFIFLLTPAAERCFQELQCVSGTELLTFTPSIIRQLCIY